jgi:Holliday junction resolvase RusA-like endonuclease
MSEWREFTIPGETVPWARAGAAGKRHFTPAKQRSFMGVVKMYGSQAMGSAPPLACAIELHIVAVYQIPASWPKKRRADPAALWKTSRPDTGNIAKLIEDALNTVCWQDDALIVSSHTWKRYGDVPRLLVRFRPAPPLGGEP